MDALDYAAWVLKPTSGGVLPPPPPQPSSLPAAAAAKTAEGSPPAVGSPMDDNAGGAEGTMMKSTEKASDASSNSAGEEEALVDNSVLLFIDVDDDDNMADAESAQMETVAAAVPQAATAPNAAAAEEIKIPLIDYLCALNECSLRELQLLMYSVQARKRMVAHLQQHCRLRTAHLRPADRNQWLHAHDLSTQSVNRTYACGGYLELTVRQYFYAKHGLKIKHHYLPCLIEFGGGEHTSFYPLEVVQVVIEQQPLEQWKGTCPSVRARRAIPWLPSFTAASMDDEQHEEKRAAAAPSGAAAQPEVLPPSSVAAAATPKKKPSACCNCCGTPLQKS